MIIINVAIPSFPHTLSSVLSNTFTLPHFIHDNHSAMWQSFLTPKIVHVIATLITAWKNSDFKGIIWAMILASWFVQWRFYNLFCYVAFKTDGLWKTNCERNREINCFVVKAAFQNAWVVEKCHTLRKYDIAMLDVWQITLFFSMKAIDKNKRS
jgi:hypothetical protein